MIHDLHLFLAIIEEGSQTAAAKRLGCSLQSVNRALAKLEGELGLELIRRTTRRSVATEAGMAFYRRVKPALDEITRARSEVSDRRTEPRGLLRMSAPSMFATVFVVPALKEYQRKYPRVDVQLSVSDAPIDVIASGFDISIRIRTLPDSTLTASRLGQIRIVTYGSKSYFETRGRPKNPGDLQSHNCILGEPGEESWIFNSGGSPLTTVVRGNLAINDVQAKRAAVINGMGIARGPYWHISDLAEAGELEILFEDCEPSPIPVYAVFPPSRLRPAKTRLFLQELKAQLQKKAGSVVLS